MEEEGGGAPGTTVGSGSESIRSTASALRWVPQDLRALLILVTAGTQALLLRVCPNMGEGSYLVASPVLSRVSLCPWPL